MTPSVVFVVRDVPSVSALRLLPDRSLLVSGSVVIVVITAAFGEVGLLPSPTLCCLVNGVNVSRSFVDMRNGTYSLSYTVGPSDRNFALQQPALLIALVDSSYPDAHSDTATTALNSTVLTVDTLPPHVHFTCVSWANNTVRPTNNETLCVTCNGTTDESVFGCTIFSRLVVNNGVVVPLSLLSTGLTTAAWSSRLSDRDVAVFTVWAVDAAGNLGPPLVWSWLVDSLLPVTVWPSFTYTTIVTSNTAPEFVLGCNRPAVDCRFAFSLDKGTVIDVGAAASNTTSTAAAGAGVDTTVHRDRPQSAAVVGPHGTVSFTLTANTTSTAPTAQYRVDGSAAWAGVNATPVQQTNTTAAWQLTLSDLSEGIHRVEVRAVDTVLGPDSTPWTEVWYVDTQPPTVTLVLTPEALSVTPATAAVFVLQSTSPLETTFHYRVRHAVGNLTAGSQWSESQWNSTSRAVVPVGDLTPGTSYRFEAYGVDVAGNVGSATSFEWASAACPTAADAVISTLNTYPVDYGERIAVWGAATGAAAAAVAGSGFEYSLDGSSVWNFTTTPTVTLTQLQPGVWHSVRVRAAVPGMCVAGPSSESLGLVATSATWFEVQRAPGAPGIITAPPALSHSAYADFAFNSTALAHNAAFQYALDSSSWSGCDATLRIGPLQSGVHQLQVRGVAELGRAHWSVRTRSQTTKTFGNLLCRCEQVSPAWMRLLRCRTSGR